MAVGCALRDRKLTHRSRRESDLGIHDNTSLRSAGVMRQDCYRDKPAVAKTSAQLPRNTVQAAALTASSSIRLSPLVQEVFVMAASY